MQETSTASAGDMLDLVAGCWDPHEATRIVTAGNNGIQVSRVAMIGDQHSSQLAAQ